MHSAQRCIARTIAQRPALHCAQRFTASVAQCVTLYTPPPPSQEEAERSGSSQEKPSAAASGGTAQRSTKALPVQQRLEALHKVYALAFAFSAAHIQRAPLHSAQSYTVRSATQCAAMHSAQHCIARTIAQRPALHCAQRFIASVVQCATLYPPPPPASPLALHSAQHYTAPSTTLHRAQRAKTRPIAASEPSIYKWWNISVSVQRLLRSNGTRPCESCKLAHARAFVFQR